MAVALTASPPGTATPLKVAEKDALPDASVVTSVAPSQVWPSPWPLASPVGDEKNSSR